MSIPYLAGLPWFLAYMAFGIIALILFMTVYSRLTPHHEWSLIKEGNTAAAYAFSGSTIGFALPLYSAMAHSVSLVDFILWALIAFVVQVATYFFIKLSIRILYKENLSQHITDNHSAYGILVGAISIAVGILNAAAMTY